MKAITVLFTLFIVACSPANDEKEQTELLKSQRQALDKAKEVSELVKNAEEQRLQQLKEDQ